MHCSSTGRCCPDASQPPMPLRWRSSKVEWQAAHCGPPRPPQARRNGDAAFSPLQLRPAAPPWPATATARCPDAAGYCATRPCCCAMPDSPLMRRPASHHRAYAYTQTGSKHTESALSRRCIAAASPLRRRQLRPLPRRCPRHEH